MIDKFDRDLDWSRTVHNEVLAPWYRRISDGGRYVSLDKGRCATLIQKRMAVDTILQSSRDGSAVCVEEKMTRWPYAGKLHTNFFLETDSCTVPGKESPGWMKYGEPDFLLYGFALGPDEDVFRIYLIEFDPLKAWFWKNWGRYRSHTMSTLNRTRGRLVPIEHVRNSVGFRSVFDLRSGMPAVVAAPELPASTQQHVGLP